MPTFPTPSVDLGVLEILLQWGRYRCGFPCHGGDIATNPYISEFTLVFIEMLTWAIIARSLLSWFPVDQSSPLFQMLYRVTDPILDPIKRVMPQNTMIDLSPMAAIFMMLALSQMVRMLTAYP